MARFSESVRLHASPEQAWATASDLSRLGEWMLMHDGWRGELPEVIAEGTTLTSVVSIKGLRNRITWRITDYDAPRALTLVGDGVGGTTVSLGMFVRPDGDGSVVGMDVEFTGKLVVGPIGMTVKRALKGDVHTSIKKLGELIG